jgi:hypothetical protein
LPQAIGYLCGQLVGLRRSFALFKSHFVFAFFGILGRFHLFHSPYIAGTTISVSMVVLVYRLLAYSTVIVVIMPASAWDRI